ncbi:hypothetical protein V8E52_005546 [Russula decolorans]
MHDNVLSMEMEVFDTVSDIERDERSCPTGNGTQDNDHQPKMPLGIELTGYYLLTTSVILGIGVPKAIYSYKGQALISTTLDWLGGMFLALILFWLGVIEAKRPGLSPRFFEDDLAPPILSFLCRREVHGWCLIVSSLLLSMRGLRATLDARRNYEYGNNMPVFAMPVFVIYSSIAICTICLGCVRAIWPSAFRGTRRPAFSFIIDSVTYLAYDLCVVLKLVWYEKDYPPSIIMIAVYNILWMYYSFKLIPVYKQPDSFEEYKSLMKSNHLMSAVCIVLAEAVLIGVWGYPDFDEGRSRIFVSGYVVYSFSFSFFASILTFWVTYIWRASKVAFDSVRSAGNEAWACILSIGRKA